MLERIDIVPDLIPLNHIFDNFKDCLIWIEGKVMDEGYHKLNDVI